MTSTQENHSTMRVEARPARVFVSYAHDSPQHRRLVLRFCSLLLKLGVDVRVDEWDTDLRRDWFLWMIDQFRNADFVIVVASPRYRAAGDGTGAPEAHRGVQTESAVLRDFLYLDRATWTRKILPVILPGRSVDEIPLYLQPHCASHYHLPKINAAGAKELVKVLGRPPGPPAPGIPAPSREWQAQRPAVSTLPRGVPSFTGRAGEVDQLTTRIVIAGDLGAAAVHVVNGMPGVGKTAFAVHVAQKVADRFPDGQLFLELHGHSPGREPVTPDDALRSLLLTIGVTERGIPSTLDDRARMWRDRLAGRRMLLVLDDVVDHDQVRPLLPGTPGCQVVITSRRRLPGLEDAQPLPLAVLDTDHAVTMFLRLANRTAADHERHRIFELVRLCGHLPLAIALVAGRLRSHPSWDVAYLTEQLVSAPDRLAEMRADDLSVTTALELSYRELPDDVARLFRRLSAHPGTDFDLYAAAALSGRDLDTTQRLIETLYLNHLVEEPAPGRYRLHDLVRHYARGLDPDDDTVTDRLLDYYLHVATQAAGLLSHHGPPFEPSAGGAPAHIPPLATESDARQWFARERLNLNASVDHASNRDRVHHTVGIAAALHPHLTQRGHWDDALAIHNVAALTAERGHDMPGLAVSLRNLAAVQLLVDDYPSALVTATRAQRLYVRLEDRRGEADTLALLGAVRHVTGDFPAATANLERALTLSAAVGDRFIEATARFRLGVVQHLTESYSASSLNLVRAFTTFLSLHSRQGQADALSYLGLLQGMTGDYSPALRCLTKAIALFAEVGDRRGEADALCRMGTLLRAIGEYREAHGTQVRAHTLFVELGSYQGQARTLRGLAMTRYLAGDRTPADHAAAADTLQRALELCGKIGDKLCEAGAYNDLGVLAHLSGRWREATASLVRALALCEEIGDPAGTVEVLNNLGRLAWDCPEAGDAFSYHERALRQAREIGAFIAEGRALEGMGLCLLRDSYGGNGRAYLREALEVYERLGMPDAQGVKAKLAELERK
jgi:tetratricopeptide (TPR) repeat protein